MDGVEIEEDEEDVLDLTVECEAHADTADSEDDVLELGADCEADAELEAEPEPEPVSHDQLGDEHCEPAPEPGGKLPLRRRRNRGQPVELVQALGDHRARHAAMHKDRRDLDNFTRMAAENPAANSTGGSGEFHHTPAAIDKLRSVPPQDLSLVQMVERLAMALNERQESARTRPPSEQASERDAALAEALKALAVFTEKGMETPIQDDPPAGNDTESELRDALSKLQTLQGAA